MNTYDKWIEENVDNPLGRCRHFCDLMRAEFPELTLTRGHYFDYQWGEREHWWLTDSNGNVVDPTVSQFPSKGVGFYEPRNESEPEPTDKCIVCGGYIYENDTTHDEHLAAYARELNGERS